MYIKRNDISETRQLLTESLEFWRNTWDGKPDHLGWSADKPNVIWLCSRRTRVQVVLDRDITRDEVASIQTTLRNEGRLYSNAGEIELAF